VLCHSVGLSRPRTCWRSRECSDAVCAMHKVVERGDDNYSGSMSGRRTRAWRESRGEKRSQTAWSAGCRLVNTVGAASREDAVYRAGS
jgi:hypothetical protein